MTRFSAAFIALVAPVVLAVPSYPKYGPAGSVGSGVPTGVPLGPTGSAPYPVGNETTYGPTGTGTGVGTVVSTTELAVSTGQSDIVSSEAPAGPGESGVSTSPLGATGGSGECGPATVTVTSANTVTVTVGATSAQVKIQSTPSTSLVATSAPFSNGTSTAPIGTGSTGLYIPPVSTGSPILPSTTAAHGYKHVHLHHQKPAPVPQAGSSSPEAPAAPYVPVSSSSEAPAVFAQATPEATSTTEAAIEQPSPAPYQPSPAESESSPSPVQTTEAATSSAVSHPSTGGDVKPRGLVYNTATLAAMFSSNAVGWCYNWNSSPGGTVPGGLNYVPMMWGDNQYHAPNWKSDADSAIAAGATHLLGFNEPDLGEQANMTPDQAKDAWKKYMEQYAGKAKLGSPAVCNGGGPVGNGATMGLNWLNNFLNACSDCTIDFLAIHWYGQADEVENFKSHVADAQKIANGKPIWITEFKPDGAPQDQANFLKEVLPWLDSAESGVERYSVFQVDGVLTNGNSLTELGKMYDS